MAPVPRSRLRMHTGSNTTEISMTPSQTGLVDSCFEEAHYESGIAVLDQLRSTKYKPSPAHIRQLLYISLYTPAPIKTKGKDRATPGSPTKALSGRHESSTPITLSAIHTAQRCLMAFALTNTPSSLIEALPSYPTLSDLNQRDKSPAELSDYSNDGDSYVAHQAAHLKDYKDCWQILKEDSFVRPEDEGIGMFTGSPSKRRRASSRTYRHLDDDSADSALPVASSAWPILDWLLVLFETDERRTEQEGQPRYSPLLLSQIPPIRSEAGAKWAVDAPLDAALHCLIQDDLRKRSMGARLLTLMINLTSTTLFDLPLFLNLMLSRFPSKALPLQDIFFLLPLSQTVLRFKVLLCHKYLSDTSASGRPSRAPVRAQPRPIPHRERRKLDRSTRNENAADKTPSSIQPQRGTKPQSIASRSILPSAKDISDLITRPSDSSAHTAYAKFELLSSYMILQTQAAQSERSEEFLAMLKDGRLAKAVEESFGSLNVNDDERHVREGMKEGLLGLMMVL